MISTRPPAQALPPVALSIGAALAMLAASISGVTNDMVDYLIPWYDHIVATGRVAAFAEPFSNYTPPYLYLLSAVTLFDGLVPSMVLIKLLSVAGTVTLALAVRHLLIRLNAPEPTRAAALMVALPTAVLNAGLLGQCDAMWAAPCVMALAAAVERRHVAMLIWCGIAFGFKAQAALVAPFFLALLINRRVPIALWPIAPAVFAAMMLPACAAGWPASSLATIYLHQAGTFTALSLNAPNIWAIVQVLPLGIPLGGLATAAAIGATAAYLAHFSTRPLDQRTLLAAALLAPLLTAGLLPRMHERYFFLADILSLVLALTYRDKRSWTIALLIQAGSLLATAGYFINREALVVIGALAMITATVRLAAPLLRPAANDNPIVARAF